MLVENGNETFDIKNCMAEEQNNYYSETLEIHIVCERVMQFKKAAQTKKRAFSFTFLKMFARN